MDFLVACAIGIPLGKAAGRVLWFKMRHIMPMAQLGTLA